MVWSSPPTDDANASVAVPVIATVYALAIEIVIPGCCAGPELAGNPPMVTAGNAGGAASDMMRLGDGDVRKGAAAKSASGTARIRLFSASNSFTPWPAKAPRGMLSALTPDSTPAAVSTPPKFASGNPRLVILKIDPPSPNSPSNWQAQSSVDATPVARSMVVSKLPSAATIR